MLGVQKKEGGLKSAPTNSKDTRQAQEKPCLESGKERLCARGSTVFVWDVWKLIGGGGVEHYYERVRNMNESKGR